MQVSVAWLSRECNADYILKEARKHPKWNLSWDRRITDTSGDWRRLTLTYDHPYSLTQFMRIIRQTLATQGVEVSGREVYGDSPLAQELAREIDSLERRIAEAASQLKKTRNWLRDKRIAQVRRLLEREGS